VCVCLGVDRLEFFFQVISFEVPLFKLAMRPGTLEPSLFFAVERGIVSSPHSLSVYIDACSAAEREVSVVGVSSQVITERNPATPHCDQLRKVLPLVTTSRPKDILFTHTVSSRGVGCSLGEGVICLFFHPSSPPSLLL
jgi:hypothetical protein